MQTMITTLTVRVPISIENMEQLSSITQSMRVAHDDIKNKNGVDSQVASLTQTVESDTPTAQLTPAPGRRGPNKAKAVTVQALHEEAKQEEATKDTSKAGTEVTQPAWKVQAGNDPKAEMPGFLNRSADAKTKAA